MRDLAFGSIALLRREHAPSSIRAARAPTAVVRAALSSFVLLIAPTLHAQADDDDILAPAEPEAPAATGPVAKKVGLVTLVAVGDASKPLAEQVTARLQKELTDSKLAVGPLSLAPQGGAPVVDAGAEAAKKAKASADKELVKAQKLLAQMQLGRAEPAFQKAVAEYVAAAAVLENASPLIDARLGLAEVYARQGMEDEANESLTIAAVLNPEMVLDAAKYPPQFIRSFQKLRDRALAGERGALYFDETARGATIAIGSKAVGTAPLRVNDLPVGQHLIRLELTGVGVYSALVDVEAGLESTVSGGFFAAGGTSVEDLLAANQLDADAVRVVAAATKAAGLDVGVVGVVGKKRSTVPVALVAVLPNGSAQRLPQLDFDGDLLNLAIETLKAHDAILAMTSSSTVAPFDAGVLLEGMKVGVVEVAAVTMRYDVVAGAATDTRTERKQRVAGAEPDDSEGRQILAGGTGGRKRTLKKDEDRLSTRAPRSELTTTDESDSVLTNPWLWIGVGSGTAVVLGAVASGAAIAIWYFILPPTSAEVSVVLPE
jgi:tetratricopeptide (TPR) repeat protein